MTLPASGAISLSQVNVELGSAGSTTITLGQSSVRTLFGIASGAIKMSDGYGKSNRVVASATISSNTANYTVSTDKASGYVAGKTDFTLTINSGVVVYSNSTGSYALTINTSWAAGDTVTIINNGVILGRGGNGNGGTGGPALLAQRAVSINNINRIAGGGGGGGQGGSGGYLPIYKSYAGGGGGGGGIGNGSGGAGGQQGTAYPGGNGGAGTLTTFGGGGGGAAGFLGFGNKAALFTYGGGGGNGGSYGSTGSNGGAGDGGGGGSGGAAGGSVVGNSNITWIATGTRNGSIS